MNVMFQGLLRIILFTLAWAIILVEDFLICGAERKSKSLRHVG
jgi:hypothetical protein